MFLTTDLTADWRDRGIARRRVTEGGPCLHQLTTLFQKVAALIRELGFVAERMSQSRFANIAWEGSNLSGPIAKGRTETVNHHILPDYLEHIGHRHLADSGPLARTDENIIGLARQ